MTLHAIVAALGGDLYAGGTRANVPAPGHGAADRSVSLLLSDGRVVVHGFGAADWKAVRDHLRALALIDAEGRVLGPSPLAGRAAPAARPDRTRRIAAARALWEAAGPVTRGSPSQRHLALRAVSLPPESILDLRHHPAAPLSVFGPGAATRPALAARVSAPDGSLTAVELVYLSPNGRREPGLRLSRKTVGAIPPGSAVRLAPPADTLLVGEGVMTVLSAASRFGLPGWALLSATNVCRWSPPAGVRAVVIAADAGRTGEAAADQLRSRLRRMGLAVRAALPPAPFDDWNAVAMAEERREQGRGGAPARRG